MRSFLVLGLSILGGLDAVSARSSISWLQPQRSALIKLDTPGYPLWVSNGASANPSSYRETSAASAVLLNITMSADNKTLLLNHEPMLPLRNYNIPPQLLAYQVRADLKESAILALAQDNRWQQSDPSIRGLLLELDYDRLVEADPTGGPPYYNHIPTLRFRIMGFGAQTRNDVLEPQRQDVLLVTLVDQNKGKSDDPKRSYAISGVQVQSTNRSYDKVHKGPEADAEKECTRWSWTCPDAGMYEAQSPYHRFIWRRKFDQFGRVGSLRHAILQQIGVAKQRVHQDSQSAILVVIGILLSTILAIVAGFKTFTKPNTPKKGSAKAFVEPRTVAQTATPMEEDDDDEIWLAKQAQQAGEVEITANEVVGMIDLVSDHEDEDNAP